MTTVGGVDAALAGRKSNMRTTMGFAFGGMAPKMGSVPMSADDIAERRYQLDLFVTKITTLQMLWRLRRRRQMATKGDVDPYTRHLLKRFDREVDELFGARAHYAMFVLTFAFSLLYLSNPPWFEGSVW